VTRRLTAAGLLAAAVLLAALLSAAGPGTSGYRVDALFDNTDFLIPGQDVKIGGARAGTVKDVHLTRDRKARVELEVDERFGPFRENAECSIRPQGLIGEKFVQCDPGTPSSPRLGRHGGKRATVPIERTHSPVDLDLVFSAMRRPVRERLTILLNELGTGLAGRPEELNAAIRRANPAIQQANRTLSILDSERSTLGRLIDTSDRVLAELAQRRGEVRDFIENAADVSRATADRRGDLDLAVRRLPPMLAELEPSATELEAVAREARPIVTKLGQAAPQARNLLADFDPLADSARPTLKDLSRLSRTGRRAVRAANPVADRLALVANRLPPLIPLVRQLTDSLVDQRVAEHIGTYAYYASAAASRFDRYSHILPSYQVGGPCAVWTTTPVADCDAHYAGYRGDRGGLAPTPTVPKAAAAARRGGAASPRRGAGTPSARPVPAPDRSAPALPPVPAPRPHQVTDQLLDWLLGP
jgi:phospholipid/cholesterol/gamma-HCH transport system substrate-binding protein